MPRGIGYGRRRGRFRRGRRRSFKRRGRAGRARRAGPLRVGYRM